MAPATTWRWRPRRYRGHSQPNHLDHLVDRMTLTPFELDRSQASHGRSRTVIQRQHQEVAHTEAAATYPSWSPRWMPEALELGFGEIQQRVGSSPEVPGQSRTQNPHTECRAGVGAAIHECRQQSGPNSDHPQTSNSPVPTRSLVLPSRFPRSSQARPLPSRPPIRHIRLLHTCGIRGGPGSPQGGR